MKKRYLTLLALTGIAGMALAENNVTDTILKIAKVT